MKLLNINKDMLTDSCLSQGIKVIDCPRYWRFKTHKGHKDVASDTSWQNKECFKQAASIYHNQPYINIGEIKNITLLFFLVD
jgi:hypothetical protein